jgi:amino acid transporter
MPLKRALGLAGLVFYGVGIILGAGIYSVLGSAAGVVGPALWISFAISSAVALLTALSYAELAAAHPRAAAEFTYLRAAVPNRPSVALVTGLLVALSGAATASTVAIAFAGYLRSFVDVPAAPVAALLVAAAAALNLVGVKESGWVNAAFTLLEAAGLVLFVVVGVTGGAEPFGAALSAAPTGSVISGAALVFFSYLGFENIANLAEEAKAPERDLPRAIFLSLGFSTALYVLVALAAIALMPPDQLAASSAPLADAARTASPRLAGALGGIALFATANTALVSMLVASRAVFGIARDGELPSVMAKLLSKRDTPWVAILAVAAVACALLPFGKVGVVASISSFAALVAFATVNAALIVLRYREPDVARPFRVPGSIGGFPILPAFGVVTTLGIATQLDRDALVGGAAALGIFAGYALWRHLRRRSG